MKDTVLINDPRNRIQQASSKIDVDSGEVLVPFDKINPIDEDDKEESGLFAWLWWLILLVVVSISLFIFLKNRKGNT